jgi:hypothetical protein
MLAMTEFCNRVTMNLGEISMLDELSQVALLARNSVPVILNAENVREGLCPSPRSSRCGGATLPPDGEVAGHTPS